MNITNMYACQIFLAHLDLNHHADGKVPTHMKYPIEWSVEQNWGYRSSLDLRNGVGAHRAMGAWITW